MRTIVAFLVLALGGAVGCTNTPAVPDTGSSGDVDAGRDAGHDAAPMPMTDAGHDAASTPMTDAGEDAAPTPIDAGTDAASTPTDAGTDAAPTPTDAGHDAAPTPTDAGHDAGCTGVLLTVINVLSWCDVTVDGGTAFGGAMETVCVPASSDVTLVHTAHAGFILGDWFGTNGDSGSGDPGVVSGGMSTAHLTTGAAGTSACVSVCCPFTSGAGCPSTDSCP